MPPCDCRWAELQTALPATRADPERAGGEREGERSKQAQHPGPERPRGPATPAAARAPPTGDESERSEHPRPAQRPSEGNGESVPGAPAVPAPVEDEGHEDPEGSHAEAEHIARTLIEYGKGPPQRGEHVLEACDKPRRERRRARRGGRRPDDRGLADRARRGELRAGARLRVGAIPRNFDARAPVCRGGASTIAFTASGRLDEVRDERLPACAKSLGRRGR